jgi:hypothetical protein
LFFCLVSPKTTTRSLITRLAMSRYLKVDNKWTQKSAHNNQTTLNYSYRVTCQENYFGEYCGALCKPRDDKYGHFSCSPDGEKLCYPGWHGNYCEKGRFNSIINTYGLILIVFSDIDTSSTCYKQTNSVLANYSNP